MRVFVMTLFSLVLVLGTLARAAVQERGIASGGAASPGPPVRLGAVDAIIQQAIADHNIPGAVLVVGHDGKVIYRKAYGERSLEPRREAMTVDTIFDMASLTKVIATTTAVMQMMELGKMRLNDPVAKYIPDFAQNGKEDITIRQLLTHYSGLAPDIDLTPAFDSKDSAFRLACAETAQVAPGSEFIYSDTNFIMLGWLVEKLSGETLDVYTAKHVFQPLKMMHTRFLPPAAWKPKIAPTQYDEHEHMIRGVVHDPRSQRMGGVAGHAGLFSTGDDLAKFAQALLNGGDGILSSLTVKKMSEPEQPPSASTVRGFGWDIDSPFSSIRGDL
ncbi:MAG: serine hydrolase domain-containing protein, partial [Candidatus Sulfotelmatobacter sp.]